MIGQSVGAGELPGHLSGAEKVHSHPSAENAVEKRALLSVGMDAHPGQQTAADKNMDQALEMERFQLVFGAFSIAGSFSSIGLISRLAASAADELAEIDRHITADRGVDLWRQPREGAL